MTLMRSIGVHRHGAPKSFPAEVEFTKEHMITFLNAHKINPHDRRVREITRLG